ncbi:hypothetical protein [Flavobacterium endoglycinae]|uniref:hypothetical protein n=1 Tax=Flavobacterium endoglycinae TaxID=2816357 RepID=UPI001EF134E3|nr:hypothetical protein [Flavobacterium endoglycinae]
MKKLFIILLSITLLVPSFGKVFIYASFKLNQKEISKTICVQRKMVFNTCNGRCELQKSLKKYADNEKKMQDNLKEKAEIVYIQNTNTSLYTLVAPVETAAKNFASADKKPVSITVVAFRPPSCFI